LNFHEVRVRPVERSEETLHRQLMAAHHYLGYLPKIGHTLWYVATYHEQWVALLSFSAAAWKCAVRDRWIGWDFHHQYDYERLKLIANNSRFLILPNWHHRNLGSKILSLCHRRLASDWQERFGHRLVLLETFVDPRFHGTVYRAANWLYLGLSRGYRRTRQGYSNTVDTAKKVFVKALQTDARRLLEINRGHWTIENSCHYILDWNYDEDRCRIRTGYGPENITRLRRFAISVIKSKGVRSVAQKMRQLNKNTRLVFDYLRMTTNSCAARHA
jgi:hypothetical protein